MRGFILRKPEVVIGTKDNFPGQSAGIGNRKRRDLPGWRQTHYLVFKSHPEIAIWPGSNAHWVTDTFGEGKLFHLPSRRDAPNGCLPIGMFGEPDVAIGASNNLRNHVGLRDRQGKLGELPGWRDAPNLIAKFLRKPEGAIRPGRNPRRVGFGRGRGKLGHLPGWRDAPNGVVAWIGKPEVAIRPGGNPGGSAVRWERKRGDLSGWCDTPDVGAEIFR